MKFKNFILAAGLLIAAALPAHAQTGFNYFAEPRIINLTPSTNMTAGTSSNFWVDIHGMAGTCIILISGTTNGATTAFNVQFYTSSDRTNTLPLANYAIATMTPVVYTNINLNVSQTATNNVFYPGVKTTPNASQSGFATSYVAPAGFTNTGAINVFTSTQVIGFSLPDNARYLQAVWTSTGAATNTMSAVLIGRKDQE